MTRGRQSTSPAAASWPDAAHPLSWRRRGDVLRHELHDSIEQPACGAPSRAAARRSRSRPGCSSYGRRSTSSSSSMPASVARFGAVDRLLREVVAQHVARVGRVHRARARSRGVALVAARARRSAPASASNCGSRCAALRRVVERVARTAPATGAARSTSASARKNSVMSTSRRLQQRLQLLHQLDVVVAALGAGRACAAMLSRSAATNASA